MINLIIPLSIIASVLAGGLFIAFKLGESSGKKEIEAQQLKSTIKEVLDVKQDIEDHRGDSIDVVRNRMSKYTRQD